MRSIIRKGLAALALGAGLLAGAAAHAQGWSPVGTWSYSQQYSSGQAAYAIIMTLYPNGQLQEYVTTNMGASTYVGQWRFNAQNSTLDMLYQDYNPKQFCNGGMCYPVPATLQIGSPYSVPLHVMGQNQMELQDANGPMLYVRQQ